MLTTAAPRVNGDDGGDNERPPNVLGGNVAGLLADRVLTEAYRVRQEHQ